MIKKKRGKKSNEIEKTTYDAVVARKEGKIKYDSII